MPEFKMQLDDVKNLLEAAATDANDVSDFATRNAIENLIRAVQALGMAVVMASPR